MFGLMILGFPARRRGGAGLAGRGFWRGGEG